MAGAVAVAIVGGRAAGAVPGSMAGWRALSEGEPFLLAVVSVRLVTIALALWWLILMARVWAASALGHHQRARYLAGRLPLPLRLAVSASLSPLAVSLAMPMVGAQNQPPTGVPASPTTPISAPAATSTTEAVLELRPLPSGGSGTRQGTRPPSAVTAPGAPTAAAVAASTAACPTIVTQPDLHWFDQARQHLDGELGRPSSQREAEAYFQRCVAHNADRLPDAAEPDVVPPGQPLELPELPRTL
ncbi:MAG: hypothetical protein R2754_15935 [Microthrixaceae bacterium]